MVHFPMSPRTDAHFTATGKGQLISEQIYAVLNFPNRQQNIAKISALVSKMGQIKKIKAIFYTKL